LAQHASDKINESGNMQDKVEAKPAANLAKSTKITIAVSA
jgi:hypothetical protein